MFDINCIELENFKSFSGQHKFKFPTEPGLYFITGDNQDETRLERNGAGKSTLLDAINWVLYGRTLRDLKGQDVVTWGKKGCRVSIELTVADRNLHITRTQHPNSLTLDNIPIEQDALNKHLVIGDEAFAYAVIKAQFGQSFFERKPAAKLELFSQILNLDLWLQCSQKAAAEAEKFERSALLTSQNIDSTKELVAAVAGDIAELQQKEAAFTDEQKVKINQLEREIDESDVLILTLKDAIKKETESLDALLTNREQCLIDIESIENKHKNHRTRCSKLENTAATLKAELNAVKRVYDGLTAIKASCPTCLQPVNKAHLSGEKEKQAQLIASLQEELLDIAKQHTETQRFINKTNKDLVAAKERLRQVDADCTDIRVSKANNEAGIRVEKQAIKDIRTHIKDEEKRPNPYTNLIAEREKQQNKLTEKLKTLEQTLAEENSKLLAYSYWINGFKRVRLFLVEETLTALELEVNSALTGLGLVDWQVEFDVERENKSGGLTKGFMVFIRCPKYPEPVKLEAYSGGEGQRLQQAGDLGLANLIMMQAGLTNKIEFYDEPSAHLSDAGLTDLAETLQQRAVTEGKRIFIIDHRTINFGEFTDVIKIVKTAKGSEIVYDS